MENIEYIQVSRIFRLWDPVRSLGIRLRKPLALNWLNDAKPISSYMEVKDRKTAYHKGRILYFLNKLREGEELDPIMVESECDPWNNYPIPLPLVVDGNHRLISYALAKKKVAPVVFSGRIDLLEYLTGKRKQCPK